MLLWGCAYPHASSAGLLLLRPQFITSPRKPFVKRRQILLFFSLTFLSHSALSLSSICEQAIIILLVPIHSKYTLVLARDTPL